MKNILVVEDEIQVRKTIVEMLENSGYNVLQASNGAEAIDNLKLEIPDLVISDIMMPLIDGYELLENLRNNPSTELTPVIFLTAKLDYPDVRKAMASGAEDYLFKPFRLNELLTAVETQLLKKEKISQKLEEIYLYLSAAIPHELLTPLIPMLGYPNLLTEAFECYSKDEILNILNNIERSGTRLHRTVRKFLKYLEVKTKRIDMKNFYASGITVHSLIAEVVNVSCINNLCNVIRRDDLIIEMEEAEVAMPPEDIEFIIEEIISNAFKFSESGSKVVLLGKVVDCKYRLSVGDNGCGMNQEQLKVIIPSLVRGISNYAQCGIGLGLITTKNILEYYGGELNVESSVDKGTICTLLFPLKCISNETQESLIAPNDSSITSKMH